MPPGGATTAPLRSAGDLRHNTPHTCRFAVELRLALSDADGLLFPLRLVLDLSERACLDGPYRYGLACHLRPTLPERGRAGKKDSPGLRSHGQAY